jgi:hypothetical protein
LSGEGIGSVAVPRRLAWTWLALLALSQAADLATTWLAIGSGLTEQNPFVRAALRSGHFPLYAGVKLTLIAAMALAVTGARQAPDRRLVVRALRLLVVIFTAVSAANLGATLA